MDKLKPILAQKFWILLGVALLLPVVGWFLGTGRLAAAIDERVSALNALNVPNGSAIPNDDWMKNAAVVEAERKAKLDAAGSFLWQEQQKYMEWPPILRTYVESKKFEDELELDALHHYRNGYNIEREKLLKIVDPLRFNEMTQKYEGKVMAEPAALATLPPDSSIWPTEPPTSQEVWYLQEEMWLLRGLLEAVRDVNDQAGADSIVKAPIKQIDSITLQGGDMAALEGGGEAGMEGGGMDEHGGGPSSEMMGAMMSRGGMGMGAEGGAAGAGSLDFDLAEEVGPNTMVASAEGEGVEGEMADDPSAAHGGGPAMGGMAAMMGMGTGGGGAAGGNPLIAEKRYVDDDAAAPFKTRAFKMQVVMDHRQIPEFLVELTNSPFPVRVLRVHWSEANPDPRFAGTGSFGGDGEMSSGRGGMGGSRGGMGGMGMGRGPMGGGRGMSMPPMGGMGSRGGMGAGRGPMGGGRGMSMPPMGGGRGMSMPPMGGGRGMSMPPMGGMGSRGGMGMGNRGGMGMRPGGALPGMDFGGEGGLGGETGTVDLYSQAMANPYLAQVVVGGLITIYRSPQEMAAGAAEAEAGADAAAEGADAAATPAGDGTVDGAVDGAAVDGAVPVEGAGATDPATDEAVPADGTGVAPEGVTPGGEAAPTDGAPSAGTPSAEAPQEPAGAEAAAGTDPSAAAPGENPVEDAGAAPQP